MTEELKEVMLDWTFYDYVTFRAKLTPDEIEHIQNENMTPDDVREYLKEKPGKFVEESTSGDMKLEIADYQS